MKPNIILITAALLTTFCILPIISFSQAGSLDVSFDTDGIVTTAIGTSDSYAKSVVIQSDGKILVAGSYVNGSSYDFALTRYNSNGSLDSTFSSDGIAVMAIGLYDDIASSLALQADGKIIVAGSSRISPINFQIGLVRFNSNGTLDSTFDNDGIVTTSIDTSGYDIAHSVAIQSDGKILTAGWSMIGSLYDISIVRYKSNGSLDSTFDNDGILILNLGNIYHEATAISIQSDGKILVAGQTSDGTDGDFALVRIKSNGSLDSTFDNDGIVTISIGSQNDIVNSLALQSDGKIVLAGKLGIGSIGGNIALARLNTDGSLDNTFDSDGIVTLAIGVDYCEARSVVIQNDMKIVAAGLGYNGNQYTFAIIRYTSTGALDSTFNTNGIVLSAIGPQNDEANSIALQSDGKIVVVGSTFNGASNIALVRYINSVDVGLNETINQSIEIYTNPFSKQIILRSKVLLDNLSLTIYNSLGQIVCQIKNVIGQNVILPMDNLSIGMYYLNLTQYDKTFYRSKFVITD